MKAKNDIQQTTISQEDIFREKSHHYLVCFIESCPLREQCLRWLVGQYADPTPRAQNGVNPRNPKMGGEQCEMFRRNQRVVMKCGFTNLYHEMPGYMEHNIRCQLIATFGRKKYFEMRRGDRLVTPAQQETIATICRLNGWQGPLIYDDEQEDWLW